MSAEWEKPISHARFCEIHAEFRQAKELQEKNKLKEAMKGFNERLRAVALSLAQQGRSAYSVQSFPFELKPYGIVAPSHEIKCIISMIEETKEWNAELSKEGTCYEHDPHINVTPQLNITRRPLPAGYPTPYD